MFYLEAGEWAVMLCMSQRFLALYCQTREAGGFIAGLQSKNCAFALCLALIKRVKQCLHRPRQALMVPEVWGSQISRHSAHEDGKNVSPTHRSPLGTPRSIAGTRWLCRLQGQGHSTTGRITSMINCSDTIGNVVRDLPTCSAVVRNINVIMCTGLPDYVT